MSELFFVTSEGIYNNVGDNIAILIYTILFLDVNV